MAGTPSGEYLCQERKFAELENGKDKHIESLKVSPAKSQIHALLTVD
jgi:hypothetical protein